MPGYLDRTSSAIGHAIVSSHLSTNEYNVIYFEWRSAASGPYCGAVKRTKETAEVFSDNLLKYYTDNNSEEIDLQLIGHSLGSQLGGMIGDFVIQKSRKQKIIRRITGLDPARQLFYKSSKNHHLNKNDAKFVDIMHTDCGSVGMGFPISTGHADFWPNGGKATQPRCKGILKITLRGQTCSHIYVIELYAESIIHPSKFEAMTANNWKDFTYGKYRSSNTAIMGAHCNPNARGNYYLTTDKYVTYDVSKTVTVKNYLFNSGKPIQH